MPDRKLETLSRPESAFQPETLETQLPENEQAEPASAEQEQIKSEKNEAARAIARPTSVLHKMVAPQTRDDLTSAVEKILEEDISEAYQKLSPIAKQEFKLKGEHTASTIRKMMTKGGLKVKKIFALILHWLKMLPGINRFFLEQEAKIKTDRIIILHRERTASYG